MTTYVSHDGKKYFANDNVEIEMSNMDVSPVAREGLIETETGLSQNLEAGAVDVAEHIEVIIDDELSLIPMSCS